MPSDTRPCPADAAYGAHAKAHPAVATFCDSVSEILRTVDADQIPDEVPNRVAEALGPLLATPDLLCDELRQPSSETYCKHVLYACPDKHFTLLALVWLPGQGTVIHGHTAWGAVGVYAGTPNVACYDCVENDDGRHVVTQTKDILCAPGDTATVRPGLCDVHRIYNASDAPVVTLHAYGLDLIEDPDAINLDLNL